MKIVYFYQYYSTPKGSWGTRVYEFTKKWVEAGHDVTVVTSIYAKSDLKADKLIDTQYFEGVKVKVINVIIDNKQSFLKRIWTFIQYVLLSLWFALTLPADVVIASSGPITVGIPGLVAHYLRGRKLVFEVRDLWPSGAIELGFIKNKLMQRLMYAFENMCYKAADMVVALSPGMKQDIERRFGHKHIITVTNSANIPLFSTPRESKNLPEFFKTKKVAIYPGNIGITNNSELLFDVAVELKKRNRTDIMILLIGEGQQREMIEQRGRELGLDNFKIMKLIPKEELVALLQKSLAGLVTFKSTPVLDATSPNKFFEALAVGLPIVQTTQGWIKNFVAKEKCGFTVGASSPEQMAEALIFLADHPETAKEMGKKSDELARKYFDKDFLADKMLQGLLKVHHRQEISDDWIL